MEELPPDLLDADEPAEPEAEPEADPEADAEEDAEEETAEELLAAATLKELVVAYTSLILPIATAMTV